MTVFTFGAATIIPKGYFGNVENYVSKCDPVPWTSWRFYTESFRSEGNITFLQPTTYCPLLEHGIMGKTYFNQIKRVGDDFCDKYLN